MSKVNGLKLEGSRRRTHLVEGERFFRVGDLRSADPVEDRFRAEQELIVRGEGFRQQSVQVVRGQLAR